MPFLVRIIADIRRESFHLFKKQKPAYDIYFRAFAAVTQKNLVRTCDNQLIELKACFLYEVSTNDMTLARESVRCNQATCLLSSCDSCGPPIVFEELFRSIH